MEPDYSSYSLKELKESLSYMDREAFPERAARIQEEIQTRKSQQYNNKSIEKESYRWTSTERNTLFLLFSLVITAISLSEAISGSVGAIFVFCLSALMVLLFSIILFKKSGWVEIDEDSISLHNIWGYKKFQWIELTGCYVQRVKYSKTAILTQADGGEQVLPIVGQSAQEICEIVNKKVQCKEV